MPKPPIGPRGASPSSSAAPVSLASALRRQVPDRSTGAWATSTPAPTRTANEASRKRARMPIRRWARLLAAPTIALALWPVRAVRQQDGLDDLAAVHAFESLVPVLEVGAHADDLLGP